MGRGIIRMVLVGVLCASGLAVAMPTKDELKAAGPVVQELMAPELKLLKSGGKKQAEVAATRTNLSITSPPSFRPGGVQTLQTSGRRSCARRRMERVPMDFAETRTSAR